MHKRHFIKGAVALGLASLVAAPVWAADTVKIGLILPMTGQQASTGREIEAAARLYMAEHGNMVAGKKIELIVKDDAALPDTTKRIAQELVVNDKVAVLAGFGITPCAFATAPIATQAKVPMVVMAAGTSVITERSPYITRTSFTLAQSSVVIADWAAKNKIKKVITLVSDYAPGLDAEKFFAERFKQAGGEIAAQLRVPLRSPDFTPALQRVADEKPDAVFVFVPSGAGATVMKQFAERGLDKSGIKLIATGDVTDDEQLNGMGSVALGVVTAHMYSAAHKSAMNQKYVAAFEKANKGMRPNFMSVGGYDGMHLIYKALEATKGNTNGDAMLAAMKGLSWESPRGPISIDPETRDIVQDIYIRKVERQNGQLYNVEFETVPAVKDPGKSKK